MKKSFIGAALVAFGTVSCVAPQATEEEIHTEGGPLSGTQQDNIRVYKGIPYAAAPTGDRRWRAPGPPPSWGGVKRAEEFGPACAQQPMPFKIPGMKEEPTSEDCLFLNIWTPAENADAGLPVMVWIHGGAFRNGSGSTPFFDGGKLAKRGVVLVTINYRLGVFGFLAHPELTAESETGASGNYALMDQIAALKWVKSNIAAFGGDPDNVTIFGESAGGGSVMLLTVSPQARGFFHAAISESGAALSPTAPGGESLENPPTLKAAEDAGRAFAERAGAASLAELRAMPVEQILATDSKFASWPIADGAVVPGDVTAIYRAGKQADVPLLLGWNSDEGAMFARAETVGAFEAAVRSRFADRAEDILPLYPVDSDADAKAADAALFADVTFAWPAWSMAAAQQDAGSASAYVYYFNHVPRRPPGLPFKSDGALHGDEIAYVFGNFMPMMPLRKEDRAMHDLMASYWVNFAKTHDPNGAGLPEWPAYEAGADTVMHFHAGASVGGVPGESRLKVIDSALSPVDPAK